MSRIDVIVREVALRDGLQLVSTFFPTGKKLEWIRDEAAAGMPEIEVTSYVPPKLIPQFVDASRGDATSQIAVLGLLLTLAGLVYNLAVAAVFGQFKRTGLGHGILTRHGDGVIGALFLMLAGRLAMSKSG